MLVGVKLCSLALCAVRELAGLRAFDLFLGSGVFIRLEEEAENGFSWGIGLVHLYLFSSGR